MLTVATQVLVIANLLTVATSLLAINLQCISDLQPQSYLWRQARRVPCQAERGGTAGGR